MTVGTPTAWVAALLSGSASAVDLDLIPRRTLPPCPPRSGSGRPTDRPRERLAAQPPSALSARELLAVLLGSGGAGRTALDLASEVLVRYGGSLRRLGAAEPGELATAPGIGPARACALVAAFELGRRATAEPARRDSRIQGPGDVYRRLGPALRDRKQEEFWAVYLDTQNRVISRALRHGGPSQLLARSPARGVRPGDRARGGQRRAGPQPPERRPGSVAGGPGSDVAARRERPAARASRSAITSSSGTGGTSASWSGGWCPVRVRRWRFGAATAPHPETSALCMARELLSMFDMHRVLRRKAIGATRCPARVCVRDTRFSKGRRGDEVDRGQAEGRLQPRRGLGDVHPAAGVHGGDRRQRGSPRPRTPGPGVPVRQATSTRARSAARARTTSPTASRSPPSWARSTGTR